MSLFIPNGRGLEQGGNYPPNWEELQAQAWFERLLAQFPPQTLPIPNPKPNPLDDLLGRVSRFVESLQEAIPNETKPTLTITVTIDISGAERRVEER